MTIYVNSKKMEEYIGKKYHFSFSPGVILLIYLQIY